LRFSEAATCNRLAAAYAARKYPVILDLLADGSVNLTTVRLLAPHLTPENHEAVLAEAVGKTKGEIEMIRARLSPRPDVPASIRKAPTPAAPAAAPSPAPPAPGTHDRAPSFLSSPPKPVEPLAPDRFHVHLTVDDAVRRKLRYLQDLTRRANPTGDIAVIFERGLDLQIEEAEKKAFAATTRPRAPKVDPAHSDQPPAHVKRAVWARDGGQCAFAGPKGRCSERSYLEFHHLVPRGHQGKGTLENIALRCRAHNVYEAELLFGPFDPSVARETGAVYG
jgi:hypothetical protein